MPKITVIRTNEWNNMKRKINIYIDDKEVGHIGTDEAARLEVLPGKHILMLTNQWPARNTSFEVDLSDNQDKTIKISTPKRLSWTYFILIFLITVTPSLVRSFFNIESFWAVHLPVAAVMLIVALFVISKTDHLKLEDVKSERRDGS